MLGDKCYGVYTVSNADTKEAIGNAKTFCEDLTPAGRLVLPTNIDENDFVQNLGKLTQ